MVGCGTPIKEVFEDMRAADPPVYYLADTPKGKVAKLEHDLLPLSWASVRQAVNGNLLPEDGERSLFVEGRDRIHKKRAMCWRLKKLVKQLNQLELMRLNNRQPLPLKLGAVNRRGWPPGP